MTVDDRPQEGRRWIEHTGEAELEIRAWDEAGVLRQALAGLAELLGPPPPGLASSVEIAVRAGDRPALLVAWLEELLWVAERDGVVPERVAALNLADGSLRATVDVRRGPPRPLVKAVTWHDLRFERVPDGWEARVVFDV